MAIIHAFHSTNPSSPGQRDMNSCIRIGWVLHCLLETENGERIMEFGNPFAALLLDGAEGKGN
ncbi:hypothetical protein DsansV1_C03g0031681 [Dioscorea sansibarensis]